jgi:hypothetical protein
MAFYDDTEIKLLGLSAPALMKMLRHKEQRILGTLYGEFKGGKTDFLARIAEWSCVRDQIYDIESVLRQHEKQEEILHGRTPDSNS